MEPIALNLTVMKPIIGYAHHLGWDSVLHGASYSKRNPNQGQWSMQVRGRRMQFAIDDRCSRRGVFLRQPSRAPKI